MPLVRLSVFHLLLLSISTSAIAEEANSPSRQELEFFEKRIRPVLVDNCYECHSEKGEIEGGLRVDLREGLLKGGDSGPAVIPGNLNDSVLISALEYKDGLEMPPDGQLPENVIRHFKRWIRTGAADSRTQKMKVEEPPKTNIESLAESLWSLQPVENPEPPSVKDTGWVYNEIDEFLLAQMEEAGVTPVGDASPEALIRRVTFDLIGLPPEPQVLIGFAKNPTREFYESYINDLLNSPRFGERWARHWFDIARYGESAGNSRDVLMPYAWRYRDYVIDTINADVPYDRFVTEQIAGDLLEADSIEEKNRLQVATGFLAVGSKSLNGGNLTLDLIDDQIDVIGKAVLGMTVSCARCHDHKFDPIPTADYYAMVGILNSTETLYGGSTRRPKDLKDELDVYLPLGTTEEISRVEEYVKTLKRIDQLTKEKSKSAKNVQSLLKELPKDWKEQEQLIASLLEEEEGESKLNDDQRSVSEKIEAYRTAQKSHRETLNEIKELESHESPEIDYAIGVREGKNVADEAIRIRGEAKKKGDIVERGFLSVVSLGHQAKINSEESGRRELAAWLVDEQQPLTPRVAVNRIWMHLFGRGIVETVANFGTNAAEPTHPELLDHLAHRFVHEFDWSRKSIIREIVLSRAYQLSSRPAPENLAVDAPNKFYWRFDRRRLEAEPLRDAMLFASGELETERPQASIVAEIGEGEVGRGIKDELLVQPYPYRSVYLPIIRGIIPEFLKVFDFPEPSNPQGTRLSTNVPAQSLFLMNSPFVIEQSEKLAELLVNEKQTSEERIQMLYLRTLSRLPSEQELANAKSYVEDCLASRKDDLKKMPKREQLAWATLCQAVFASGEFRYID